MSCHWTFQETKSWNVIHRPLRGFLSLGSALSCWILYTSVTNCSTCTELLPYILSCGKYQIAVAVGIVSMWAICCSRNLLGKNASALNTSVTRCTTPATSTPCHWLMCKHKPPQQFLCVIFDICLQFSRSCLTSTIPFITFWYPCKSPFLLITRRVT